MVPDLLKILPEVSVSGKFGHQTGSFWRFQNFEEFHKYGQIVISFVVLSGKMTLKCELQLKYVFDQIMSTCNVVPSLLITVCNACYLFLTVDLEFRKSICQNDEHERKPRRRLLLHNKAFMERKVSKWTLMVK